MATSTFNFEPLTDRDYEGLAASWIDRATAQAAGVCRVDRQTGADIVCRNHGGDYSGLVFPIFEPGRSDPRNYCLRRDHPDMEYQADGTLEPKNKYLFPPGSRNMIYFPLGVTIEDLANISLDVVVTEGIKKTLSLHRLSTWNSESMRFLSLGLSGCWNWRGTRGKVLDPTGARVDEKGPIPDLDRIAWNGRKVTVLYDTNVVSNPSVASARRGLAEELQSRGANVYFIDLPEAP